MVPSPGKGELTWGDVLSIDFILIAQVIAADRPMRLPSLQAQGGSDHLSALRPEPGVAMLPSPKINACVSGALQTNLAAMESSGGVGVCRTRYSACRRGNKRGFRSRATDLP
jgi:hypothetical protein